MLTNSAGAGNEKAPLVAGTTKGAKVSGKTKIVCVWDHILPWAPYCLFGLCCVLASLGRLTYA